MKFEKDMILKETLFDCAWNDEKGNPIDFGEELDNSMIITKRSIGRGEFKRLTMTIGEFKRILENQHRIMNKILTNFGREDKEK